MSKQKMEQEAKEHTGKQGCCMECLKAYKKSWQDKHAKEIKEKKKALYAANKEEIEAKRKAQRVENPEKFRAYQNAWYAENTKEINAKRRAKYAANHEKERAKHNAHSNTRNRKLENFKRGAKGRGLNVTMTDDEIIDMMEQPCFYCGLETIDAVKRNGVDRLDSSVGYDLTNCRPCCHRCNISKGTVDPTTFVERCRQISLGEQTTFWSQVNKLPFSKYKNKTLKAGKIFKLTKTEYDKLRADNCDYCKRPSTEYHSNGIDCINSDPKVGYILSNCVSCCRDCNMMKYTESRADFLERTMSIAVYRHIFPNIPRVLTTFIKKN
jgi:hypothetical protein